MDNETLIRAAQQTPKPAPEKKEAPKREDDRPTDCGLTREELRAIVAEIIG